jgi:hypothetical protein
MFWVDIRERFELNTEEDDALSLGAARLREEEGPIGNSVDHPKE